MKSSDPSPANAGQAPVVRHNRTLHRFETELEGLEAVLEYSEQRDVWILTHTFVPPGLRGRGIAGLLTQTAIEAARREKRKLDPQCSFAAAYLEKHPEYDSLRVG